MTGRNRFSICPVRLRNEFSVIDRKGRKEKGKIEGETSHMHARKKMGINVVISFK